MAHPIHNENIYLSSEGIIGGLLKLLIIYLGQVKEVEGMRGDNAFPKLMLNLKSQIEPETQLF